MFQSSRPSVHIIKVNIFPSGRETLDEAWMLEALLPDRHCVWVGRGSGGNRTQGGGVITETSGMGELGGKSILDGGSRGEPSMGRDACEISVQSVELQGFGDVVCGFIAGNLNKFGEYAGENMVMSFGSVRCIIVNGRGRGLGE